MDFKKVLSGKSNEPYIIAETAFSHEGSIDYLKKMVDQLKDNRNIAIKFQVLIHKEEFLTQSNSNYKTINKWLLKEEEWKYLIEYAYLANVPVILAVLDNRALDIAINLSDKITALEVHPSCIPDAGFMKKIIGFCEKDFKPLIIGVSGFSFDETEYMINNYLSKIDKEKLLLMYGFQDYPTNIKSLNLKRIKLLEEQFQIKVAYADHTEFNNDIKNILIGTVYGSGVNIIEIHYVLEYGVECTDYITAYDSKRIIKIKEKLSMMNQAFGEKTKQMSESEKRYSEKFRKIAVFSNIFSKGHLLKLEDIRFKRSNKPSQFSILDLEKIIGKNVNKNVIKDQEITLEELE